MSEEREQERDAWCRTLTVPAITVFAASAMAFIGWSITVETRLQRVATIVEERGPHLSNYERDISELYRLARSPEARPETRVMIKDIQDILNRIQERQDKTEERINNFHHFILTNPVLRPPSGQKINPVNR